MQAYRSLITTVLRDPGRFSQLSLADWDVLLPQARRSGLLARLAWLAERHGQVVAAPPGEYLQGSLVYAHRQAQAVHYEVERLGSALGGLAVPVILLKGAAYELAGLPCAHGRTFSDIDLLVPRERIAEVERALLFHGWAGGHHSAYDQRYYRQWMHEIPPLQHVRRLTVLDLHHAILPLTARIRSDPRPLFENARRLHGFDRLHVLAPADMVLHSATHLFTEGEWGHGLRDLVDLDALLRHFAADEPGFWAELERRARLLNLTRPLYYALRYCRAVLETPIPDAIASGGGPLLPAAMDVLLGRALAPEHESCEDRWSGLARWLLYLRGHWLRMPLHLLLPHLFHKAFIAPHQEDKTV